MMKQLFALCLVPFLLSGTCKHSTTKGYEPLSVEEKKRFHFPEHTEVDWKVAEQLKENYHCDDCLDTGMLTKDVKLEKEIIAEIERDRKIRSIHFVNARYRSVDFERYRNRHPDIKFDPRDDVNMKATLLMEVRTSGGKILYFDIMTICPPPGICDTK